MWTLASVLHPGNPEAAGKKPRSVNKNDQRCGGEGGGSRGRQSHGLVGGGAVRGPRGHSVPPAPSMRDGGCGATCALTVQAPPEVAPGSEVFLKKVQQCDFIVLAGLGAADAVSLVGVDLGGKRRQAGGTEDPALQTSPSESGSQHLPSGPRSHPRPPGKRCCSGTEGSRFKSPLHRQLAGQVILGR